MIPHHVYCQVAVLRLLWLCVMLHSGWPSRSTVSHPRPAGPVPLTFKRKRFNEPKPFAGLTQKPHLPTHRRPRGIDTSMQFCPHTGCDYRGWLGLGNLCANGHPSGGMTRWTG